jgi:pseudouridine-5'-phosphate glycosidase
MNPLLDVQAEVATAIAERKPVVALESTLISHGMPWPRNAETALAVEAEVRSFGAVPATIAVVDGRLKAGLGREQIERLARGGSEVAKVSRRDLPIVVARGRTGATTVAATMAIAALAGIRVFATGGIGGVHRGAETSFDISADLQELARTPVAVVCAGPKAILDLRLTLEYLETHGVPVIGYRTDRLPAFYTSDSDFGVDVRLDEPAEIARVMKAKWDLGLGGGVVVANPIAPRHALAREVVEQAIGRALDDARTQGISGKAVTPFLLARVNELTGGDSLLGNIRLVLNNARLAAAVAGAHAALERAAA